MGLRAWFRVRRQPVAMSLGLLLARIMVGAALTIHGWGKIQQPFGWMGENAFAPGWLQALAALSEFGGGIAWALGALMPLASFGLLCTMAVAVYVHLVVRGDPLVQGYELALLYLCVALVFLATGPGAVSLDRALFGERGSSRA